MAPAPSRSVAVRASCALLGAVLSVIGSACDSEEIGPVQGVRPGHALADGLVPFGLPTTTSLPVGQEVIVVVPRLLNDSERPLEITKLRVARARDVPAAAQVVRTGLVDPGPVGAGLFTTYPPVTRHRGACVSSSVRPARGTTLMPGDKELFLVWLRAVGEGGARVSSFRVSYEQDDALFQQTVTVEPVNFRITTNAEPISPSRDERACASGVRLLPGAVHI